MFLFRQPRHYCQLNPTVPVLRRYFSGEDTRPDFCLSRASIQLLLRTTGSHRHHGWGPELETLVLLFWLASGASYRVVARVFDMPLSTVHRIVHRAMDDVMAVRCLFIHLPRTLEEVGALGEGFAHLAGHQVFSKAAGAIDGSHIRVQCPGAADGQDYKNRKLFSSVVLQAVCDHTGRFLDIFVGYPGSVHDSRILKNSPISVKRSYPPPGYFILADGGYPCQTEPVALITPYKQPVRGVAEQRFNAHHSRGRIIIERAFGMMKSRFRCIFQDTLEVHVDSASKVMCTLHSTLIQF